MLDVVEPEDDQRMAWVVADEGKGLDLVLEVLHKGDRDKDLVENVERYARLGIPEYFVYDRARQQIHGYPPRRAGRPGATSASSRSSGTTTRPCWASTSPSSATPCASSRARPSCPGSDDLIRRLQGMTASLEAKAEQAQAEQAQAQAQAERAQAQAEQAQAQAERAQAQAEQARAEARAVLTVLRVRGIAVPDDDRARILAEGDAARLERWLERAAVATSLADVLVEPGRG